MLARCIPGCESLTTTAPDQYAMRVTAGVAAIKGTYEGEVVLVQITSTLFNGRTDYQLLDSDAEFAQSGLANSSCIRCHKLFVLACVH